LQNDGRRARISQLLEQLAKATKDIEAALIPVHISSAKRMFPIACQRQNRLLVGGIARRES
jgi:hypothetical protein